MTKLSITFLSAMLTMSLTTVAQAYGTEPTFTVASVTASPTTTRTAGVCTPRISPALALALALPKTAQGDVMVAMACAE